MEHSNQILAVWGFRGYFSFLEWLLQVIVWLLGLVTADNGLPSSTGCWRLQVRVLFFYMVWPLLICIFSLFYSRNYYLSLSYKKPLPTPHNWNTLWISAWIAILWSQINTCCLSLWLFIFRLTLVYVMLTSNQIVNVGPGCQEPSYMETFPSIPGKKKEPWKLEKERSQK